MNFTTARPRAFSPYAFFIQGPLPGLLLCALLAVIAQQLAQLHWLKSSGFSTLTVAIMLGMVAGNIAGRKANQRLALGTAIAKQQLLRLGIVLYGFRLTLMDVAQVGVSGLVIDLLVIGTTFALALWLGQRLIGLDRETTLLIGAGASICGAAAVMATEPVAQARPENVVVAVATVVVFGTLSLFLYPALFQLNQHWAFIPGGAQGFGLFTGSTIHEVAQVVAAAQPMGPQASDTAVIAKMVRVMLLAPFLLLLALFLNQRSNKGNQPANNKQGKQAGQQQKTRPRTPIPWFAFGFIAIIAFNSFGWLPVAIVSTINTADTFLLAMAMAALGLSTHLEIIKHAGFKPLLLAFALFIWLIAGGAAINAGVLLLAGY